MSNIFTRPIDKTLSGATTLGQNRPGSNDNEGVLHISKTPGLKPTIKLFSYM